MEMYEQRFQEFGEAYEDFEHADLINLVIATGDWLERLLMDSTPVETAMKALYASVVEGTSYGRPDAPWRELWEDLSLSFDVLRTSQCLVELNAFAFWGLRPDLKSLGVEADEAKIVDAVRRCVSMGRDLLDAIPSGWGTIAELQRTVLAAEARLQIDTGGDVRPEQLAALARVSVKSIRNLLTPQSGSPDLKLNEAGELPGADALRWLQARSDFKSSLWQSVGSGAAATVPATPSLDDLGDVIFVPVAKDGSWFDPVACRNRRGYTIGPKGAEEPLEDYQTALKRLERMPVPYWRRPNAAGNWGSVAGVSWRRKVLSELGPIAQSNQGNLP